MINVLVLIIFFHQLNGRTLVPMKVFLDTLPDPAAWCAQAQDRLTENSDVALTMCVTEAKKTDQAQR